MKKPALTELKKLLKPYLDKCVQIPHTITPLKEKAKKALTNKNTKKKLKDFISILTKRWRLTVLSLSGFFILYYGVGATVSSKINNPLDIEIHTTTQSPSYTANALAFVLKTQVDDSAWVPALPIIFPAYILDNLPNFQLGVKDSTRYLTQKLSLFHADNNLKEAASLLDYPANIWLFSQTEKDKFSPGSAKQYRKALAKLRAFAPQVNEVPDFQRKELSYMLTALNKLLTRQINRLAKQTQEHNSEMLDIKSDDIFYYAQGNIYTIYYVLSALAKEHQNLIVENEQYEYLMSALKHLKTAISLSPLSIQNGMPEESYTANHLLYLAFYLSQAQNQIYHIISALK